MYGSGESKSILNTPEYPNTKKPLELYCSNLKYGWLGLKVMCKAGGIAQWVGARLLFQRTWV